MATNGIPGLAGMAPPVRRPTVDMEQPDAINRISDAMANDISNVPDTLSQFGRGIADLYSRGDASRLKGLASGAAQSIYKLSTPGIVQSLVNHEDMAPTIAGAAETILPSTLLRAASVKTPEPSTVIEPSAPKISPLTEQPIPKNTYVDSTSRINHLRTLFDQPGSISELPNEPPPTAGGPLKPSGFTPEDSFLNNPKVRSNMNYAFRAMGPGEFDSLMDGAKQYSGDKAATRGNYLSAIPQSAAQYGSRGKYLVEFGNVRIAGDEGLLPGSTANKANVTRVWQHTGNGWQEVPTSTNGMDALKKAAQNQ